MALQLDDPHAQLAVLDALAGINAARTGYAGPGADAADPVLAEFAGDVAGIDLPAETSELGWYALAEVAAIALDALDAAGGDSGALIRKIHRAATGVRRENRT